MGDVVRWVKIVGLLIGNSLSACLGNWDNSYAGEGLHLEARDITGGHIGSPDFGYLQNLLELGTGLFYPEP